MGLILLIVVIVLIFGGGGGYSRTGVMAVPVSAVFWERCWSSCSSFGCLAAWEFITDRAPLIEVSRERTSPWRPMRWLRRPSRPAGK